MRIRQITLFVRVKLHIATDFFVTNPMADPGGRGAGDMGLQLPLWAAQRKEKQAKTMYLVRCGQVATHPGF